MILQIADWFIKVKCDERHLERLPNFHPFLISDDDPERLFLCRMESDCVLYPEAENPTLVHVLEGRTIRVWVKPDCCVVSLTFHQSGLVYRLRADRRWQQIITDCPYASVESSVALNDFIMLSFIYSSAFHQTVLLHASCVRSGDDACAFVGPSGVGKSTHARLWLQHVPGAQLLNDDQPVLRRMADGSLRIYGSPWSGKTFCYRNESARLCVLFFMKQALQNRLTSLRGIELFQRLLEATSLMGREVETFAAITETLAAIAGSVPAYWFENLPDASAVAVSRQAFVDAGL